MRRFTRKRTLAVLSVVAVLAVAGAAVAFFTSTGSGTGQGSVGSAGEWSVEAAPSTGTMYPGAGSSTIAYTVTNVGKGQQKLSGTETSVAEDKGNVTSHSAPVAGCLASWFSTENSSPAAADLAPGKSTEGSVAVKMSDAEISQNACQGVTPDITISAS